MHCRERLEYRILISWCSHTRIEYHEASSKNTKSSIMASVAGDGKHTKKIDARISKGMEVISEILSILMMRQTMLTSVLLSKSETWLWLTLKDLSKLEAIDRMFLRRIFQVQNSTAIPFLYLETECIPIKSIMKMIENVPPLHLDQNRRSTYKKSFLGSGAQTSEGRLVFGCQRRLTGYGTGLLVIWRYRSHKNWVIEDIREIKLSWKFDFGC